MFRCFLSCENGVTRVTSDVFSCMCHVSGRRKEVCSCVFDKAVIMNRSSMTSLFSPPRSSTDDRFLSLLFQGIFNLRMSHVQRGNQALFFFQAAAARASDKLFLQRQ